MVLDYLFKKRGMTVIRGGCVINGYCQGRFFLFYMLSSACCLSRFRKLDVPAEDHKKKVLINTFGGKRCKQLSGKLWHKIQ